MSACKTYLAVVLLPDWVRELQRRIVARNQLNCRGSRPHCHAQLLAATNRVTEQLSWLTVESLCCSISWMASLIDNLYHLDLVVLVIN